ncbi:ArsR/SmtB family transcription factor [Pseudoclavibacter sp. CFCC 11306]|uniref:ArsR/SmtB family transcription factor n=1 Tax=Pseudoclavibacter sp. CFCC 11306 TaxID=1564493 RepID=UPI001300FDFB|nr:metalloregulator ArsR/SmtB family transcription factor [Pseudoclavibacter sp. CFCC 11306]KAB1657076.1 winged helix-turn-helix transcriptional regulator [Pseudoclavibacter sp. CFCC 11306]
MAIKLTEQGPIRSADYAQLFHAVADPARLRILRHLMLGEHNVSQLVDHLGLAQSTVSAHLACLRDCGLVRPRVSGRSTYHSIVAEGEVRRLLSAAESLIAAAGVSGRHPHDHSRIERSVGAMPAASAREEN